MEARCRNRKRENDRLHDRHGKITKNTLPLYFFPPLHDGRMPVVDDASNYKVAKTKDLLKQKRLQDEQQISLPSSLREYYKEELLHNTRQDKERLNCNGKRNFLPKKIVKRPLLLPPLTTRTFPRRNSKQANEFAAHARPMKTRDCQKTIPKHLPKIKTRKSETWKDVNSGMPEMRNAEETEKHNLPLLTERTVKPLRAALLSSSATQRGLITLDLEEQFVLRFRLSNYDAKDINIATLNEAV